ncbi:DJ-1/PfpI family protein [Dyella nitratireducens]|uniref:Glutamine amidotransferase n=1 Tax=Dyella nitratireducens TaxID=1849580 RepID=A0ABQ1FWV0_9GAMM|nr:DJ-1/PfpI family protein [Dyella nitratireducens]GGA31117.1 glutamine amidotransferase [Dyella nitratireducens]GLQ42916.1 glutamine amidotransferase [Dyella nitratireducens]
MRDTIYVLVFEGFADWQIALALAEIRRPGDWEVRSAGFTREPVTSMSGFTVMPDVSVDELDLDAVALLMLPGGHLWLSTQLERMASVARRVHAAGAPVAAIDQGVLAVARAGLLDHCRHTGNWPGQIGREVAAYAGHDQYDANVLAVSDGGVITASHLGNIEFAREIIHTLDLYNASDRDHWYRLFKHAVPPPWFSGETIEVVRAA